MVTVFINIIYIAKNYILSVIVWIYMYLHSRFCGVLWNTHLFCNRMLIGCSWSSKVDDFGIESTCDFLL